MLKENCAKWFSPLGCFAAQLKGKTKNIDSCPPTDHQPEEDLRGNKEPEPSHQQPP